MDLHARRADSFGAHAFAYAEHRPDYPVAAVRWALEPLGTGHLDVLDLAAGTGKLSSVLIAEGHRVTAVEPNEAMLSELVRRVHDVRALPGHAEHIPVPDGTVDAVLVGQAFHWFDPLKAYPEIARVLRPGGVVAGLWNELDVSVPWVDELDDAARSSVSSARTEVVDTMPPHPLFADGAVAEFPHAQRRASPEEYAATIGTHSHALVVSEEERAELMDRVVRFLYARPETSSGPFDVPLVTTVKRLVLAG
ncbi:class I SAM-dependent methyltransferase [Lentzea tibetensis]|uniref:Class I SAM-dependent methyltransferase n=1 Tax=Lentzea tibetensis TaxID=2591470 RepID=A0A563EUZ2_9PSEU|nr:class I SAM-dependent methyltransferase [Lentzea tibetensis]TWP51368.1 class I SAM-dependent methyltransferase [Lentzea tibetensis]